MVKNEQWEYVHRFLVKIADGYFKVPEKRQMSAPEAQITLDVIVELVHEIERLQTESIKLHTELDFDVFAAAMYTDGMADVYGD